MKTSLRLTVIILLLAVSNLSAATHYVSPESANPTPPYTNWITAATNIQDAVDAAVPGDQIVVTNGVYSTGGGRGFGDVLSRAGGETNRVTVDKPLMMRSVNGPEATIIDGLGELRCVYLTNNAAIVGFTLTNGRALHGGGVCCESTNAFFTNCVIVSNLAGYGGGVSGGTLDNCTLSGNYASYYGGGYVFVVTRGGGARGSTLYNCTLKHNSAIEGGGAFGCTLYNCLLTDNSAGGGGGADSSTLYNCTLTGNSSYRGGGADSSTLNNCIVYFNTATSGGANYDTNSTLNYCCTTPLPPGTGNISADPRLTDSAHVSSDSPCVGAGSSNYAAGTDIDGEAWANPPSIGCDEFHAGPVTGPLALDIGVTYTNAVASVVFNFTAQINGHAFVNFWDFDDGSFVINQPCGLPHRFATPGDYTVTLWAYNDSHPEGVSASLLIRVDSGLHYVSAAGQNPVAPYTSWATAATNIQDAVDAAGVGGTILVTNGTYASGGRWANRVALDKPVTLRSVNGARFTIIDGEHAMRCAYVTNGASIIGFTMSNGAASGGGGGVACELTGVVSNCVITGNSASAGGGASGGTLYHCTLTGNSATNSGDSYGGGACYSTLHNCTVAGNSASSDGGVYLGTLYNCTLTGNSASSRSGGAGGGTLYNCIVYFNTAPGGANFWQSEYSGSMNYCCTTRLPTNGVGNITNEPLFLDYAGGNLRLQSNSPCINAGNNAYLTTTTDLDANTRIVSGTVDIGAYEFQGTGSRIFYAWLQQFGLPTDGSADATDPDADSHNNWQEWVCGTCPTNASSALRVVSALPTGTNAMVTWQSVAGVNYFLESSTNLFLRPYFTCVASNIAGQAGTTSYADTNAAGAGLFFYRVGVDALARNVAGELR